MDFRLRIVFQLVLISFLGIGNHNLIAQTIDKIGIKGGLNASKIYISSTVDRTALVGFHAGVYVQLAATKSFALQPELLYSTKGYKAQYGEFGNREIEYNLNYLDLPVVAVIKLGDAGEIHLGGYASYLLRASILYDPTITSNITRISKSDLKSYDYGVSAGLGINFGEFQIGARYNFGLVCIAESDSAKVVMGDAKISNAQLYTSFTIR